MQIGLIACCGLKAKTKTRASDIYQSQLFCLSKLWMEQQGLDWWVLSAKHGLLNKHTIIEPYDLTLNTMNSKQRQQWSRYVQGQLLREFGKQNSFVVLAGEKYLLPLKSFQFILPLGRLPIGKRLQRLKAITS
jgi:hypothetical protein